MGIVAPSWLPELEKGYQEEILDDRLLAQHLSAVLNGHGSSSGSEEAESPEKMPSLRQLLVDSKAESSTLRQQIEKLTAENHRLKGQGQTNGHPEGVSHVHDKLSASERRCDILIREKENMATELWKLRQQVVELAGARSEVGSEMDDDGRPPIDSYRSDNPVVLQKRIEDLESQIQDLHEANETASAEVLRLDQENQMLTAHINKLKQSVNMDWESEREMLHQQLSEVRRSQGNQSDDDVLHLRSEMAQLRIDLKAMKDKTNILQEENVKLRENLREIKRNDKWKGSGSSVNDHGETQQNNQEAAWNEINSLKQKIREFSTRPLLSTQRSSLDRRNYLNTRTSAFDRSNVRTAVYSETRPIGSYGNSRLTNQGSSDGRAPSPSSDISESTTILMAGFEPYKPLSHSNRYNPPSFEAPSSRQPVRALPVLSRRIEDDRMSECTQDILNEASFNAQAYGSYDVNDDDTEDLIGQNATPRRDVTSDIARDNGHVRRSSLGSSSVHSESTQERLAPPATYGLRSVIAPILPTQHNKTALTQGKLTLNTAGRRPFAPRSPADLNINDIAKFTRPDGRICRGVVKFIGHLHDKNETYVGLELEYQEGKHDGLYDGVRYFECKPNRGAFISFNKVIMVWGS